MKCYHNAKNEIENFPLKFIKRRKKEKKRKKESKTFSRYHLKHLTTKAQTTNSSEHCTNVEGRKISTLVKNFK